MRFHPPFDLTADLFFVVALARARDLRRAYPDVPFLSILGRTPLIVWFSRVTQACYHTASGEVRCEPGYTELTIMAVLCRRAWFVPVIHASDDRSVQIGRFWYDMPKRLTSVTVRVGRGHIRAKLGDGTSVVNARLVRPVLPGLARSRWTWPISFPSGARTRAFIVGTGRVHLARLEYGRLAEGCLLPLGLYVSGVHMQLPRP